MPNIFEIQFLMPCKVYPVTNTPGKNFDDDWFYKRLYDWQFHVDYKQKIQKSDILPVQVKSSFADPTFTLYNLKGYPVTSPQTGVFIANDVGGAGVYHFDIPFSSVDPGYYSGYFKSTQADKTFGFLTEPWHIADIHKNTNVLKYRNTINDFGVMFIGKDPGDNDYAPYFSFRGEFAVMDYDPKRDRTSYRDQILNESTLYALPFRQAKLYVGSAKGVPEWMMDLIGRIICCDNWKYNDLQFETPDGTEFEIVRVKGYPLVGASIAVVPAQNRTGIQQNDIETPGGIFAAYDIITEAFGTLNAPPDQNEVVLETVETP